MMEVNPRSAATGKNCAREAVTIAARRRILNAMECSRHESVAVFHPESIPDRRFGMDLILSSPNSKLRATIGCAQEGGELRARIAPGARLHADIVVRTSAVC
jgi:hypothetical protein